MSSFSLPLTQSEIHFFQTSLLAWFDEHGRHDLPWQVDKTPYRVWISEIMLQQTQVKTVIPYYERFMQSFPTLKNLAAATQDEVLSHWSGLGYYSRARNLHKAAIMANEQFDGKLPHSLEEIMSLPGIGRSTAGAILAISRKQPTPIQDGNVRRVLSRLFAIEGDLTKAAKQKELWQIATDLTPKRQVDNYTQAIMDLGATLCTRTKAGCTLCPFNLQCQAYRQNRVAELPNKKIKKHVPLKTQYFLFWFDGEELMMEKRPPTGIWGGLWCPPVYESLDSLPAEIQELKPDTLTPYRHVFSHFKLDMIPVFLNAPRPTVVAENSQRWTTTDNWLKAGLPTPIKQLINNLSTTLL